LKNGLTDAQIDVHITTYCYRCQQTRFHGSKYLGNDVSMGELTRLGGLMDSMEISRRSMRPPSWIWNCFVAGIEGMTGRKLHRERIRRKWERWRRVSLF